MILNPVKTEEILKKKTNLKVYRQQEIPKKNTFVDGIFTATVNSLCPIDEANSQFILPPDAIPEDVDEWETYEWSSFKQIFDGDDYQVFLNKIEENDIIQGGLGDCYFLSAIAALTKYPDLIRRLFLFQERSEEGCYGINFRINGEWTVVLVDDFIPSTGGRRPDFVFSKTNDNELWVVLLEKAWAKICGNYIRSVGGIPSEVFDCICNSSSENITISEGNSDFLWERLRFGKENNFIMTAGTGGSQDLDYEEVGLFTGHAYTVVDSYEFYHNGVTTRLVKLRNPWGNSEFSGDWSDNCPLWTEKLRIFKDKQQRRWSILHVL